MYVGLQPWLPDADSILQRIYTRRYKETTALTPKNPGGLGNCSKQLWFIYYQPELEILLFKGQRLFYYQGSRTKVQSPVF